MVRPPLYYHYGSSTHPNCFSLKKWMQILNRRAHNKARMEFEGRRAQILGIAGVKIEVISFWQYITSSQRKLFQNVVFCISMHLSDWNFPYKIWGGPYVTGRSQNKVSSTFVRSLKFWKVLYLGGK
jgi:hypothetical protein